MADVFAIEIDLAFVRLVETEQQFGQRALAAAGRAHQDGQVAGLQRQAQILVQPGVMFGIAEGKMAEVDSAGDG